MSSATSTVTQTVKLYWSHAYKNKVMVFGTLFSVPFSVFVNQFIPPLIVAGVLRRLSTGEYAQNEVWKSFGGTLILYIVVMAAGVVAWRIVDAFIWRLEYRVQRSLARAIYAQLLNQGADFHANSFSGSLVSQTNKFMGSYIRVADTTVFQVLPLMWSLLFTATLLVSRVPLFVVALLLLTFVYILVTIQVTKPSRRQSAVHAAAESRQTGYLADSVTNVMAIKSFAGLDHENKQFAKVTRATQKTFIRLFHLVQVQLAYFSGLTKTFQLVALVAAIISVVMFNANIATVFLVLTFASNLASQLFDFSNSSIRNYNRAFGDAREMTQILQLTPEIQDPESPEKSKMLEGSIGFNDVTFKHSGNNDALFNNLGIQIKPGEKIGLVGHSGSGKTTFTRLLLRFSDIDAGSITIDGQDIRSVTQDDLHKSIAYVPQEPLMFHRSLTDNIRYGDFSASQSQIEAVAKLAHAHEFIKDLPQGYETLVGERGVKLSGGQRQRVAIARAMIKDAPILLLNEATSALDSESEVLIQDALWKLMEGRTAIVIAHRLSTIQKMDRIIVMEEGKIVEEGSHKELLQRSGTYASLWNHQTGGFLED